MSISKQEFIAQYCSRSGLQQYQNEDGYRVDGCEPEIAVTCDCDEDLCQGWQMMSQHTFDAWEKTAPGRFRTS